MVDPGEDSIPLHPRTREFVLIFETLDSAALVAGVSIDTMPQQQPVIRPALLAIAPLAVLLAVPPRILGGGLLPTIELVSFNIGRC